MADSGGGGVVINTATLVNVGLVMALCVCVALLCKWVVDWGSWKWQQLIDERARKQEDPGEEQEEEEEEPVKERTHWTSKKPRQRHIRN